MKKLIILFVTISLVFCIQFSNKNIVNGEPTIPDNRYFAEYYDNERLDGIPVFTQIEEKINYKWNNSSPGHGINKDYFSIRWTGQFQFEEGDYLFHYRVDDGIRVWLDDRLLIDDWHNQFSGDLYLRKTLSQGNYKVKCEYYEMNAGAEVLFEWKKIPLIKIPDNAYYAEYFNNMKLEGEPVFTQIEEKINHNWLESSPGHGVNKDQFSVRWSGQFSFNEGYFTFHYRSDDGIKVWLDDRLIIDDWKIRGAQDRKSTIFVSKGNHKVTCEYFEYTGYAEVMFNWVELLKDNKVLPILIEFPDVPHQRTTEEMYNAFFSDKSFEQDPKNFISLRKFFKEVTNDKYNFLPGSYGVGQWLKMPKKKKEYQERNDLNELIQDAFQILEKQNIDLSEYDQDKNGYFDYIVFICSGDPSGILFWCHCGFMLDINYRKIKIGTYNIDGEMYLKEKNFPLQIICHEFYHYLGGEDLYSYDPSCKTDSVGPWDIMGYCYKSKSFGLSGFSRSERGWLDEIIIDQSGSYEINALCTNNPKRLYRINIPDTKEYFLIENRYATGTDSWWQGIPSQGLVIYHVDGSIPVKSKFNDGPPTHDHFAVWVENPGKKTAYCQENKLTEFTPHTSPNSRDYKNKSLSDISIVNISKSGLKMTFDVIIKNPEKPPQPLINVNPKKFDFGKIYQNSKVIETLTIDNIGIGELECSMSSPCSYIFFEKNRTKGNNIKFNFRINTSKKTSSMVVDNIFIESNGGNSKIPIKFEIIARIGDLNNDGRTNIDDFKIMLDAFGSKVGDANYNDLADFNSDDRINLEDLVIFAKNYEF